MPITSRDNAGIKHLAALLTQKKARDEAGLFACEGARLCEDAVRSGLLPEQVYFTRRAEEKYPDVLRLLRESAASAHELDDALAERISETKSPQGIFAIFKKLDNGPQVVKIVRDGNYLLISGLQDPGNLGTILRTAEALGVSAVFLDEQCPDLYSPKVLRASMGGVFRLAISLVGEIDEAIDLLRGAGVRVYAAALSAEALPLRAGLLGKGSAVLVGNEGAGLPQELVARCDDAVVIEMPGGAESLGVAAAATILLWEMTRT